MLTYFLLIVGLIVLMIGGDFLVRGAVGLAERFKISPLIIGLTIVSFGTSAPELFVSLEAALTGSGGLAIGNVVGSNIANVLLVLGVPALIRTTNCSEDGIGRNLLVMIGFTLVFMLMLSTGTVGRLYGAILCALLILFLWDQYRASVAGQAPPGDYHDEVHDLPVTPAAIAGLTISGGLMLPVGAWLTVTSASQIAMDWGISEEVIGLTIIAIGTSLPELAASVMAVVRNNASVAIGNVVGSNIFNIAAIMGLTALVSPLSVGGHIVQFDMWIMLVAALLLAGIAHRRGTISRRSGVVMSAAYAIYVWTSFLW